jgi:hypothetical protein
MKVHKTNETNWETAGHGGMRAAMSRMKHIHYAPTVTLQRRNKADIIDIVLPEHSSDDTYTSDILKSSQHKNEALAQKAAVFETYSRAVAKWWSQVIGVGMFWAVVFSSLAACSDKIDAAFPGQGRDVSFEATIIAILMATATGLWYIFTYPLEEHYKQ